MHHVNVVERPSLGRCLEASMKVSAGEILVLEAPLFVSAPVDDMGRLAEQLFKTAFAKPSDLPLVTQLFISILAEIVKGHKASVLSRLSQLRGHPEQWRQTVGQLHESLREEHVSKVEHDELLDLYSKLAANAHETDDKRAAIYSMGSLAEHSCRPSAFKHVHGDAHELMIRALTDLEMGDVVSLAYIPEYYPTWHRQELLRSFNFQCHCPRCAGEEAEVACAFVCPDCASPCCPPRPCLSRGDFEALVCEECGCRVEDAEQLQAFRDAELCERLCESCTPHLHPYHFKIFQMYLGNLQMVSPEQRLDILEQLEDAHGRLGNRVHPLHAKFEELAARSLQALSLGTGNAEASAEARAEAVSAARASWERAAALYALTHGEEAEQSRHCQQQAAMLDGPAPALPESSE
ncbi:smyd2b [Symbiodinium natans]|uniref:Smyd2b protein n=1 Tax=Symbiodinium natans TaxID=878477 RepID=A0A812J6J9_9DINO|nr:smyd2b [Symbiodinium natans]